jgi:predicted aminopeptidase
MVSFELSGKVVGAVLVVLLTVSAAGCETLQFYRQAAWGQWQIMSARQSVTRLLADSDTAPVLSERLGLSREILEFAHQHLGLESEGRYASYVELDRSHVLWNVFAARPYSLEDAQWCYPIVGCAPYRGYFNEQRALQVAQRYAERGFETYVGGVPAYSTLGWFEDPLLSTFVSWPAGDLVNLLIHELTHGKVWAGGDVAFNESLAEFTGLRGTQSWFARRGETDRWLAWYARRQGWQSFRDFVVAAKAHLQVVYAGPVQRLEEDKVSAFAGLRSCYESNRDMLGGGRYDELMAHHFNNAFLVSIGTYAGWLPAFERLFAQHGEDWPRFWQAVEVLAAQDAVTREARLTQLAQQHSAQQQIAERTDDHHTHQVNCEPFLGHGPHAETAG